METGTLVGSTTLRPAKSTSRERWRRLGFAALVAGLTSLNAWWWWRDRPRAEMAVINGWTRQGKLDDAEAELRAILHRSPANGEARMALARLLGRREDYLGCARQLHQVPEWWPNRAEARFLEAQSYKLIDRAKDAEAAWKGCMTDDPLHPVAPTYYQGSARELVGIYILEHRIDEARETLRKAYAASDPADRPSILAMRLLVELQRIRHEEALVKLRKFVATTPDDWQARRALAAEEQHAGHPDEADRQIKMCLEADPRDPLVWRTWLEILHQRGDEEGLSEAIKRLPADADADAEIWKYRGLAHIAGNDLPAAREAFARAARINPYVAEYYYRLATVEHRLGLVEEARPHMERHQLLRDAESRLDGAYNAYIDATRLHQPGEPEYQTAVENLAAICATLGWPLEAQGLRDLLKGA